ncbi:MAG: polysaccharide biosynthesis/export family protein [Candidatus Eremiobacteraeota bacterium]|nr:polysaccharide biosynthesis/export family protein [Candidatus Eremiobacteraeota bacterium]
MSALVAALAPAVVQAQDAGVIHPGDQLAIAVYGDSSLSQTAVVQADGTIQFPLVGRVAVAGKSAGDARETLAKALERYVRHPSVTLNVVAQGQINVTVLGNVKSPGKFSMRNGSHLTDAIAAAAGVASMNGEYPIARLSEPDGTIVTASLQKLLHDGDAAQNLPVSDNALVYVTGAETIRVQVLGAVSRPGNVEVNQGDRLSMAIARAGAEAQVRPDLNRVTLTRRDPLTAKATSYQVDMYQALMHGDLRFDPILQKDDLIYIPEARQVSSAMIGILGAIGRLLGL